MVTADSFHQNGWRLPPAVRVRRAEFSRRMPESRIGSIILLVMIISRTPRQAVMPSSRTLSISMRMITAKPSALASKARAPGTKMRRNELCAAASESAPASTSSFQALVICTAWETPMEKIRNGTRIDIGSMP
ncbi:hypothetical protein D9M71_440450 [compost metagenome]